MLPYYLKVREYSDLENRDIWEYELSFTPEEVDRVLMHAWELFPAWFQYFFFDENCSYHLLALLQVARPELDLVAPFRWWALPSDTVRAVTRQPGLVSKVVYRPASATVVGSRLEALSSDERKLVAELSQGRIGASDARLSALPTHLAAATLEASYDYVNYRRAGGEKDVADPVALARDLLLARSKLDVPSQAPTITTPATRPDEGHATARILAGGGRRAGRDFQEIRVRASFHDLMDPEDGYPRGGQIDFFSMGVRHFESGSTRVEEFMPFQVQSLVPRNEFFRPWSWRLAGGWRREFLANGAEPLVAAVEGSIGGAWNLAGNRVLAYVLADSRARQHHDLDSGYSLGAGPRAGVYMDLNKRWRVHLYGKALHDFSGDASSPRSFGLESRFTLGKDLAIRVDVSRSREHQQLFNAAGVSLLWYL
jgi:hypothetical protein